MRRWCNEAMIPSWKWYNRNITLTQLITIWTISTWTTKITDRPKKRKTMKSCFDSRTEKCFVVSTPPFFGGALCLCVYLCMHTSKHMCAFLYQSVLMCVRLNGFMEWALQSTSRREDLTRDCCSAAPNPPLGSTTWPGNAIQAQGDCWGPSWWVQVNEWVWRFAISLQSEPNNDVDFKCSTLQSSNNDLCVLK